MCYNIVCPLRSNGVDPMSRAARNINQVLQCVKQLVDKKGEWTGHSLLAVLVDICPELSEPTIYRGLRTLERLEVIARTKVGRIAGTVDGTSPRGIGIKVKLLRPDVTIVKGRGYFKAIDK